MWRKPNSWNHSRVFGVGGGLTGRSSTRGLKLMLCQDAIQNGKSFATCHSPAVAINSFEDVHVRAMDELKSRFHKFLNVSPFTLKAPPSWMSDEHGCLDWLDQHDYATVAYISFGRVITPPPHELIALAETLEESGEPFLWSFGGNAEERLPKGFSQRTSQRGSGKILPWADQLLVLAHPSVGVFVTHCGWNSILESIIAGVPMICRPFFGDQKINTRTLEREWGFGVVLKVAFSPKMEHGRL